MTISIHDYANSRLIVAEVPQYLTDLNYSSDDLAQAIIIALGLNSDETEYMIGEFTLRIDVNTLNSGRGYGENTGRLEEFTQDFKADVLQALKENND